MRIGDLIIDARIRLFLSVSCETMIAIKVLRGICILDFKVPGIGKFL
jgi:hypothetical protein